MRADWENKLEREEGCEGRAEAAWGSCAVGTPPVVSALASRCVAACAVPQSCSTRGPAWVRDGRAYQPVTTVFLLPNLARGRVAPGSG